MTRLGFLLPFILIIGLLVVACEPDSQECLTDHQCINENVNWKVDAIERCGPLIEAHALHGSRWTDGWNESKFDRAFMYIPNNAVRYEGNQVEFVNEYGVWRQHGYDCIYDPINKRVIDVSVW